uniref:Uncharacterized protein n=1 Tax=Rhizophora mucronata TaxID=61149 RepID=A0A2P2NKQ9_RHIMU
MRGEPLMMAVFKGGSVWSERRLKTSVISSLHLLV